MTRLTEKIAFKTAVTGAAIFTVLSGFFAESARAIIIGWSYSPAHPTETYTIDTEAFSLIDGVQNYMQFLEGERIFPVPDRSPLDLNGFPLADENVPNITLDLFVQECNLSLSEPCRVGDVNPTSEQILEGFNLLEGEFNNSNDFIIEDDASIFQYSFAVPPEAPFLGEVSGFFVPSEFRLTEDGDLIRLTDASNPFLSLEEIFAATGNQDVSFLPIRFIAPDTEDPSSSVLGTVIGIPEPDNSFAFVSLLVILGIGKLLNSSKSNKA